MAFPLKPPAEWFNTPEPAEPTPLTFQRDGRVYGHLALWDSCHVGLINGKFSECVKPEPSKTGYADFHLGVIETAEGDDMPIGKIVYDGTHASLTAGLEGATKHYDNTGAVGAFVRARDGRHGIWLSGAVRSDLSDEGFRDLRANPPSGDWRGHNHWLELIASLAVPIPGFQVPRAQIALAASANGDMEVSALILAGFSHLDLDEPQALAASAGYKEQKAAISATIRKPRPKSYVLQKAMVGKSLKS